MLRKGAMSAGLTVNHTANLKAAATVVLVRADTLLRHALLAVTRREPAVMRNEATCRSAPRVLSTAWGLLEPA